MKIQLLIFRTQIKIWVNKIHLLIRTNSVPMIFGLLLSLAAVLFSRILYSNFENQFINLSQLFDHWQQAELFIVKYLNIIFLLPLLIFILVQMNFPEDDLPVCIKLCSYREMLIRKTFKILPIFGISIVSLILIVPYSRLFFGLTGLSEGWIAILILLQCLLILQLLLLAGLLQAILKYFFVFIFKANSKETLALINLIAGLLLMSFFIWMADSNLVKIFFPTHQVIQFIKAIMGNDKTNIFFLGGFHVLTFVATVFISNVFGSALVQMRSKYIIEREKTFLSFADSRLCPYFVMLTKRFLRDSDTHVSFLIILFLTMGLGFILKNYNLFETYRDIYLQIFSYIVIFSLGTFVLNFDDYDFVKVIKVYRGNIKKYWFVNLTFLTIFPMVFYYAISFIASIIFKFDLRMLSSTTIYIVLFLIIAIFCKTVILDKDSNLFIKFAVSYIFLILVTSVWEIDRRINMYLLGYVPLSSLEVSLILMVLIAVAVVSIQRFYFLRRFR